MERYIVIEQGELSDFEQKVSLAIEQGYEPCGGMLYEHGRSEYNGVSWETYRQALWLRPDGKITHYFGDTEPEASNG